MPLLKLRTRTKPKRPITALEMRLLDTVESYGAEGLKVVDFIEGAAVSRNDARRALSALWRRGLLTRVGFGDTAVYRRKS